MAWQSVSWPFKRPSYKCKTKQCANSENPCTTAGAQARFPALPERPWPHHQCQRAVSVLWGLTETNSLQWYCGFWWPSVPDTIPGSTQTGKTSNQPHPTVTQTTQHGIMGTTRCTWPHFRKCLPQLPQHTHMDINNFSPFSWCQWTEMFPNTFPPFQDAKISTPLPPQLLLPPASVCGFLPVVQSQQAQRFPWCTWSWAVLLTRSADWVYKNKRRLTHRWRSLCVSQSCVFWCIYCCWCESIMSAWFEHSIMRPYQGQIRFFTFCLMFIGQLWGRESTMTSCQIPL